MTLAAERGEGLEDLPREEGLLTTPGGAFVTLHRRGQLRGCIGQIASTASLVQMVAFCAKAATLEDPRFEPVRPGEVAEISIELSILSLPHEVSSGEIEPGRHGLVVSRGERRGVLLPQVAAEHRWTSMRFLEETCVKAGLERDAWKDPATHIQAFTAEVFSESSLAKEEKPQQKDPRGATQAPHNRPDKFPAG